jgi:hypothetical protein
MLHELWLSFYLTMGSFDEVAKARYHCVSEVKAWQWPKDPLKDEAFWKTDFKKAIEQSSFFELIEEIGTKQTWKSEEFLPWLGFETMGTQVTLQDGVPVRLNINVTSRGDATILSASGKLLPVMKDRQKNMKNFLHELKKHVEEVLNQEAETEEERISRGVTVSRYLWKKDFVWVRLNYSIGEFINFELSPPGVEMDAIETAFAESRVASMGLLREMNSEELKANVKETEDGGLWIDHIPMVDQGQKGYCTVATMERIFRYYGIALDQHLAADLARSSALMGTRISLGIEAAEKLLKGNDLRLRAIRESNRGSLRIEKLAEIISRGLPIIWNVDLSSSDEPGNSAFGDSFAGHTRLIIGVNVGKEEIYFSDSWGLLHQKKTMSLENANRIHINGFYFEPRN